MEGEFVQVDAFIFLVEADLARARLEGNGIECHLFDENVVVVNWLYTLAVGGLKLRVLRSDAERALEILQQEPAKVEVPHEAAADAQKCDLCPCCNSPDIFPERLHRRLVYLTWLFGIPLPIITRKWRCMDCRHLFMPRRG